MKKDSKLQNLIQDNYKAGVKFRGNRNDFNLKAKFKTQSNKNVAAKKKAKTLFVYNKLDPKLPPMCSRTQRQKQ